MSTQTSQQLADVLLHHWQNLWPLPPAERIKRIDEIRLDYEYERVIDSVAHAMVQPEPEPIKPEPSNLLQFVAVMSVVAAAVAWLIILATPVPV